MGSRAKVEPGSGKHSVYTHFLTDPNFDLCLKTITRASCRRRAGTVVPWAEHLVTWSLQITKFSVKKVNPVTIIDTLLRYKIGQRSGYNPTHVNKNFPGDPEEPNEVPRADEETKSQLHWQFLGIWQSLWRSFRESLYVDTTQIGNKRDCWESSTLSEWRYVCSIVAIRSEWKLVGRFYGRLYLSAKHSRSLVW